MNVTDPTAATGVPVPSLRARRRHPLFGGLLIREGLINQAQLDRTLALQQASEPRPLLGRMLLDQKLVTPHELNAVLAKYRRTQLLGDVLVETKTITPAQLETALATQRKTRSALGDTLVQLGFITERSLKHALSIQLDILLVDLDGWSIDPGMSAVVSERYARHHGVIPIGEIDGRLVLAMDDPTDVEVVAEIRSCTGREIDVVVALADGLERAYSRLYGELGDGASGRPASIAAEDGSSRRQSQQTAQAAVTPPDPDAPDRRGSALDVVRAQMDAIRQVARTWGRWTDDVDTLLHERTEGRSEIERLTGELHAARAGLAQSSRELESKAQALASLEAAHGALLRDHAILGSTLADLRERYDALLRDRQFAIDRVSEALRRLRI